MKQQSATLDDTAILELTKKGERELREPGTALGLAQLEALILVDGFSTVDQVVKRAKGVAPTALRARLAELVAKGLINVLSRDADDILDPGDFCQPRSLDQTGLFYGHLCGKTHVLHKVFC